MNLRKKIRQTTVQRLDGTTNADHTAPSTGTSLKSGEPQVVSGIDEALRQFTGRNLVTSTEIIDLLLDLRYQLLTPHARCETVRSHHVDSTNARSQHDIASCTA